MIAFADGLRAVGWGYRRVLGCGWWRRWGEEGILDWWCTEHPDAFSADYPPRLGAAIGRSAFVLAVGCAESRSRPSVDIPEGSQRIAPLHCAPGWS